MGWQEARKRYQDLETTTDQKVEDLVARKALRGLGLVQRQLPIVERMMYGEAYLDEAIWMRTDRILQRTGTLKCFPVKFEYVVCDTTATHKEPLERLEDIRLQGGVRPVMLTRVKGTTQSMAYSVWKPTELTEFLEPPYTVLRKVGDYLVAVQDTERFFAQLDWSDAFLGVA